MVLISAGHTIMDPGDIYQDLKEADLTRKIAPKVIEHLKRQNVETKFVPLDLPLFQRLDWINNAASSAGSGALCIEIHINSGGGRGVEAWHRGTDPGNKSKELAETILKTINDETGYTNLGSKSEFEHQLGSLAFLNRTNTTTAIIETLFIDNPQDVEILKDDRKLDQLASAIASGIIRYQDNNKNAPVLTHTPPPVAMPNPLFQQRPTSGFPMTQPSPMPAMPNNFGMGGSPMGVPGFGNNMMQDREQRKEMIEKRYKQTLGRDPNPNDLNYFLNSGVTEIDLVKKLIESKEHADLIEAKEKNIQYKEQIEAMQVELDIFKSQAKEKTEMLEKQNRLLEQKNQQIYQMQHALESAGIKKPGQAFEPTNSMPAPTMPSPAPHMAPQAPPMSMPPMQQPMYQQPQQQWQQNIPQPAKPQKKKGLLAKIIDLLLE